LFFFEVVLILSKCLANKIGFTFDEISNLILDPDVFVKHSNPSQHCEKNYIHVTNALKHVLSKEQCAYLVNEACYKQRSLSAEYLVSERQSTRSIHKSDGLATYLWPIISRVIRGAEEDELPIGFGTHGFWTPAYVNECFRVSMYADTSTGFAPHRDAPFVTSVSERSIYTVLIYLNDAATSGTCFFDANSDTGDSRNVQQQQQQAECGKMLIFPPRSASCWVAHVWTVQVDSPNRHCVSPCLGKHDMHAAAQQLEVQSRIPCSAHVVVCRIRSRVEWKS